MYSKVGFIGGNFVHVNKIEVFVAIISALFHVCIERYCNNCVHELLLSSL